jgi:uncharacterized glyoxalase superfamily protein PhnB
MHFRAATTQQMHDSSLSHPARRTMIRMSQTVTVIPAVRYRDCDRAITFLKSAFGFTEHAVYRTAEGAVIHAELLLGNGMVMLGTAGLNAATNDWFVQPDEIGGKVTCSNYLIVDDCAAAYENAKAAGAIVLMPLETKDYGGSGFTVQDMEGHNWSVGDYDPWASHTG